MLTLISSIPTAVREELDVQDLPPRVTPVNAEQLKEVFGGACTGAGGFCVINIRSCCPGLACLPTFPKGINGKCRRSFLPL